MQKREGVRRRRMQEKKNQKRQNKFREKETERAGVGEWNKWISSGGHYFEVAAVAQCCHGYPWKSWLDRERYAHIPMGSHRLMCQFVHVHADAESSVQIPSGTDRKEILLAFQKQIMHKDSASSGVGLCITLPSQFGFAESYLMHAAKGFNNGWVVI